MKNLRRRDFIRNTVMAGVGTSMAVPSLLDTRRARERARTAAPKKIIVAGAGITGLCCAYELMRKGHEVVVLEASGRHGGHVYTGRDGLPDGLYTDFGADHITRPGYEVFFQYTKEFALPVLPYPNAEGSDEAPGRFALRMIDGKFYDEGQLGDPSILRSFGFNDREIKFLSQNKWYALRTLYLEKYLARFKDPMQPFGIGYDELDNIPIADIYKKEGASPAALRFLGGRSVSALYVLWRMAIMRFRGIPWSEGETFRLKNGNQELPNAFAQRLGARVLLHHELQSIARRNDGVIVSYKAYGYDEVNEMQADYLVNCISLPVFRKIPVTPALSAEKQYVVDNLRYSSHPFYVFVANTRFWLDDGLKSINMEFEHPDISSIWEETNDVESSRVVLKAYAPGGVSAQRGLAAFRSLYPGKHDTIVQALTFDWTKDQLAPTCEMQPFPIGELRKFWPQVIRPEGRIYFAGTYADNLSRGMESCLRSARRVAEEINKV